MHDLAGWADRGLRESHSVSVNRHQGTGAERRQAPVVYSAAQGVAQALQNVGSESESERPDLTVEQILAWADAHHAAHGDWPKVRLMAGLGPVEGAPGETWKGINFALALGLRGLPGDSSLAELLAESAGRRRPICRRRRWPEALGVGAGAFPGQEAAAPPRSQDPLPRADDSRDPGLGRRPSCGHRSLADDQLRPVRDAPFEITWNAISYALYNGRRGLPGGSSLARLLAEHRGVRNIHALQPLSIEQILAWADAHHAATGAWPRRKFRHGARCPLRDHLGRIDCGMVRGTRGLPGGCAGPPAGRAPRVRGVRSLLSPLTIEQILAWADVHHAATGAWPTGKSGRCAMRPSTSPGPPSTVRLAKGLRGLPGGSSLARLLAEHRGHGTSIR